MRLDSQNKALTKATTILFLVSLVIPAISFSQMSKTISGKIPHVSNDTLIIYPDHGIPDKFYEIEKSSFHIKNEEFKANLETSYPNCFIQFSQATRDQYGYHIGRIGGLFIRKP